ncbi:MAG: hypothetical protein Q8904_05345 [Bacteroidota bacterium]|nr:hypothetical protein [Bacteroidota bacterium]
MLYYSFNLNKDYYKLIKQDTKHQKTFTRRLKLLISIVVASLAWLESGAVTIVNCPLNTTYTNTAAVYSSGNSGVLVKTTATGNSGVVTYNNVSGASISGWTGANKTWYTTAINASDFYNITVTAQAMSSLNGPRDFKLQYSTNNSTWFDVANLPAMTAATTSIGSIPLPLECSFQSTLYLRFFNYTSNAISGNVNAAGLNNLFGLSIAGEQLMAPTTQASNISLVAVTPTTITIGCSQGTGTNRIIKVNTVNSFTDPVNNTNPTANTNYAGSGEQVIYNGTGTKVIITVPSSTNEYWFRAYENNTISGQTRYLTTTNVGNPKQCKLETVILPTVSSVHLTTAILGGTITNPPSGTITNRGIYWSTNPNVTNDDNKVSEGGTATGLFSFLVSSLPRSTSTIYFKAYVENLSGLSFSEESSFSNIPVFKGSGNWEDPSLWNVQEVPGSYNAPTGDLMDSPVINGLCTINSSQTQVNNLAINASGVLKINPAQSLTTYGTLTNNAGTGGLIIKSSSSEANGALINYNTSNNPVSATVEMYSKANWNTTNTTANDIYKWQFFGIPVKTLNYNSYFINSYVREWDETVTDHNLLWIQRNNGSSLTLGPGSTLTSGTGYELCQRDPKTYSFRGELENGDFTRSLPYTTDAAYPGQHIFGNPYTAAIDIEQIQFGDNTEKSVYLYNTGSYTDWSNPLHPGETTPGNEPGQYTVATPLAAGGLGVPNQIPSMQGFLVKALNGTGSISIPYGSFTQNTDPQRVNKMKNSTSAVKVVTRIDVIGTHFTDRMWIFTDPSCSRKFDNGFDGRKMLGSSHLTQLYSSEEDGNYQINALDNMNDSYLGFQPGDDSSFKLVFSHENIGKNYAAIYLVDLLENKTTDVSADGSEYQFTAIPGAPASKRFKIVTCPNDTIISTNGEKQLKMFSSQGAIFVQNFSRKTGRFALYNMEGKVIQYTTIDANGLTTIPTTNLSFGAYVAKALTNSEEITQRLLIH